LYIVHYSPTEAAEAAFITGKGMHLGQRLHDKTGVVMIDKVAHAIHGIEPRTIWVLVFQDKIQIPLRDFAIRGVAEQLRSAGEKECPISSSIDYSSLSIGRIGTTGRLGRGCEVFDIVCSMPRDGRDDFLVANKQVLLTDDR